VVAVLYDLWWLFFIATFTNIGDSLITKDDKSRSASDCQAEGNLSAIH
jgi:hypothetical protein